MTGGGDEADDFLAVGGHCPRCGMEYRHGFDTCADCGVPLVPGPAEKPRPKRPGGRGQPDLEIVTLCRLPWQDAWLLAGRLREEGIRSIVPDYEATFREWEQSLFPVLVEKSQLEEARRIATRYLKGSR